jgi:DNA-binding NarL/FixJ family response regulator
MTHPARVLIADDSARARDGLRALLATWPEVAVVGEASNGQEATRMIAECRPDIVLIDLHMPVLDGVGATRLIKQQAPTIVVIVLSVDSAGQAAALAAGADMFVLKAGDAMQLRAALDLQRGAAAPT